MSRPKRRIPSGLWQRIVGWVVICFGVFATLAATPFNGAAGVGAVCFALGGSLFFWGYMLLYLSILDEKLDSVVARLGSDGADPI